MLQLKSMVTVADNSGAKIAQMVGIPGRGNRLIAHIGDIIAVVIKKADPDGQVKLHTIQRALIIRTRKEHRRTDGSYIRFDDNGCVILDGKTKLPKGSRVFGPIPREIRTLGFNKIVSLAKEIY